MILKCRLCKIDFESPTYKPYCEPHALAYEKFKKAKSRASDNATGEESVEKPVGEESMKACASVEVTENNDEKGKLTEDDGDSSETVDESVCEGNDNKRGGLETDLASESASSKKRVDDDNGYSSLTSLSKSTSATSHEATTGIIISCTRTDDSASTGIRHDGNQGTPPSVESLIGDETTVSTVEARSRSASSDKSPIADRSREKSATPFLVDASMSNNFSNDDDENEDADNDIYRDVRRLISQDDDGFRGVICPISFNYYYGSDDDDDEEEEDEDKALQRVLTGGKTLSSLGLKPIVHAEDEYMDDDHNYLGARHRPFFETQRTKEAAKVREKEAEEPAFSTTSRFMGDEEERVDLSQLSLVNIFSQMAAFPFSRETELQYISDAHKLAEIRAKQREEQTQPRVADSVLPVSLPLDHIVEAPGSKRGRTRSISPDDDISNFLEQEKSPTISPPARTFQPTLNPGRGRGRGGGRGVGRGRGGRRGRPPLKRSSPPTRLDEYGSFYPKVAEMVQRQIQQQKMKRKHDGRKDKEDNVQPMSAESKRERRTRGIKLDYNAINEGHLFFKESKETLVNWTETKAEREARKHSGANRNEEEEVISADNEPDGGKAGAEAEEPETEKSDETLTGRCKVCGVECEMEVSVPYCKTHADMFATFKREQMAQLKKGHID